MAPRFGSSIPHAVSQMPHTEIKCSSYYSSNPVCPIYQHFFCQVIRKLETTIKYHNNILFRCTFFHLVFHLVFTFTVLTVDFSILMKVHLLTEGEIEVPVPLFWPSCHFVFIFSQFFTVCNVMFLVNFTVSGEINCTVVQLVWCQCTWVTSHLTAELLKVYTSQSIHTLITHFQ